MHILLIITAGLAAGVLADDVSTYTQQFCRTALKTSQGSGGTTTKVLTQSLTRTMTSTVTPTLTITPTSASIVKKTTVTETITKTLPRSTDTFSTTISFTDTSTVATTLTYTSTAQATSVTTSTPPTTTLSASAGFVPLASALANGGFTTAKRARRAAALDIFDVQPVKLEGRAASQQILCGADGKITYSPPQFPGLITCLKRVQVITMKIVTVTSKQTKTVAAPQNTVTQTSTIKETTTTTVTPVAASTTITVSTTNTITSTTTFSSTSTTTVISTSTQLLPQPTYFAACAPSNVVSYVNSNRIYNILTIDPNNGFSFGKATTSAYDCCVQCTESGACGGSAFHPPSGTCYLFPFGSGSCAATAESGTFKTQTGTNVGFVVSNSNCGVVNYAL